MNIVEQIKDRLSIEEVVGSYVQLKKAGRNFKALCPFHHEKTPSFVISPDKQIAYCFGCHKGGDIFNFVMEIEHVDFNEALKILADKAGVKVEEYDNTIKKEEKDVLLDIHRIATEHFEANLWSEEGEKALEYLKNRGLTEETIRTFKIGFAKDSWDDLYSLLQKKSYTVEQCLQAGILTKNDSGKTYDRFRNRIMFPLYSSVGHIVGFSGRVLKKEDEPKYLNTAETKIFNKSSILFGYQLTKEHIKDSRNVLLMEGQLDVVSSYQNGFKNVIAASGTAYSKSHIKQLSRFADSFTLLFDSDSAGKQAALRTLETIMPFEKEAKICVLPEGEDPDSMLQKDMETFKTLIENPKSIVNYLYEDIFNQTVTTLQQKKDFITQLATILQEATSRVDLEFYAREASSKVQLTFESILEAFTTNKKRSVQEDEKPQTKNKYSREDYLVGLLLNHPEFTENIISTIPEILQESFTYFFVYSQLISYYNDTGSKYTIRGFLTTLSDQTIQNKLSIIALIIGEKYEHLEKTVVEKEVNTLLRQIQKDNVFLELEEIKKEIQIAETKANSNRTKELLEKQQFLIRVLQTINTSDEQTTG